MRSWMTRPLTARRPLFFESETTPHGGTEVFWFLIIISPAKQALGKLDERKAMRIRQLNCTALGYSLMSGPIQSNQAACDVLPNGRQTVNFDSSRELSMWIACVDTEATPTLFRKSRFP
jgi:hypothetical protein